MKIYQNGDRCPCCGVPIEGQSPEWLELFSQLCNVLGLENLETLNLQPQDATALRPPDAGIFPPLKPKF